MHTGLDANIQSYIHTRVHAHMNVDRHAGVSVGRPTGWRSCMHAFIHADKQTDSHQSRQSYTRAGSQPYIHTDSDACRQTDICIHMCIYACTHASMHTHLEPDRDSIMLVDRLSDMPGVRHITRPTDMHTTIQPYAHAGMQSYTRYDSIQLHRHIESVRSGQSHTYACTYNLQAHC